MIKGKSGSITVNDNWEEHYRKMRVDWAEYYDIVTNTSKIYITGIYVNTPNTREYIYDITFNYKPSGSSSFQSLNIKHPNYPDDVWLTTPNEFNWLAFSEQEPLEIDQVAHNADGTLNYKLNVSLSMWFSNLGGYSTSFSVNSTVKLTDIPRRSTFTFTTVNDWIYLGTSMEFTIDKPAEIFRHTMTYTCGTASGAVFEDLPDTKVSWVPPLELAQQNTAGVTIPVVFTMKTYADGVQTGEETKSAVFFIPESTVVPTVQISVKDAAGYLEDYGFCIRTKSFLEVTLSPAGAYGSTVTEYSAIFDSRQYFDLTFTTDVIRGSGELALTATVKDTRGRLGSTTILIPCYAYEIPVVTNVTAQRCDASGALSPSGAWFLVIFDAAVAELEGNNTAAYTLAYKPRTAEYYTSEELTAYAGVFKVTGGQAIFPADPSVSFDIRITAEDRFGKSGRDIIGPAVKKVWSILAKGLGFAFGKIAERLGWLDMGWGIWMNQNKITDLPDPMDATDAATKAYVDRAVIVSGGGLDAWPPGSLYITGSKDHPRQTFGGSWYEQKNVNIEGTTSPVKAYIRLSDDTAMLGQAVLGKMTLGKEF